MSRPGRIEISGGAVLVWALLYYLDENGTVLWLLAACLCHELAHVAAIHGLGGRVCRLRVSCAGAELKLSAVHPLPPGRMILAALAGPAANLLLTLTAAALARRGGGERLYFFAGLNLGLACFNLLPAGWLDGGRVLTEGLCLLGWGDMGERVTELCSEAAAALLLGLGGVLLWQSGGTNFTLVLAGLWMAWGARRSGELA